MQSTTVPTILVQASVYVLSNISSQISVYMVLPSHIQSGVTDVLGRPSTCAAHSITHGIAGLAKYSMVQLYYGSN